MVHRIRASAHNEFGDETGSIKLIMWILLMKKASSAIATSSSVPGTQTFSTTSPNKNVPTYYFNPDDPFCKLHVNLSKIYIICFDQKVLIKVRY